MVSFKFWRRGKRKTKTGVFNTEVTEDGTQSSQRRKERKKRSAGAFDRKSPPFAERREGWGTLKFSRGGALVDEPRRKRDSSLRSE